MSTIPAIYLASLCVEIPRRKRTVTNTTSQMLARLGLRHGSDALQGGGRYGRIQVVGIPREIDGRTLEMLRERGQVGRCAVRLWCLEDACR
jgi:hypothetical protein